MKKNIMAAVLCLTLVFSGCSVEKKQEEEKKETVQSTVDKTEEEKPYQSKLDVIQPSAYNNADGLALEKGSYISVIGKSEDGAFWEEVKKGAEQAAADINKELGYEGKDKVRVTYSGPSESENVDEQVNILDEELARYPVAVAISIVDTQACKVQFDIATENGIPVVAFDSGSNYKGLMAMVSTDNSMAAKEAADKMAETVGEGEIVVIAHDSKSETAAVREKSFIKRIKKQYPKIKVAGDYQMDEIKNTIADQINAGTYTLGGEAPSGEALSEEERITRDELTLENVMDYIIAQHPDAKGYYATNGESTIEIVKGLERAEKGDETVIGYDADKEEIEALKNGKIKGLIIQNPFGMGYASVIAAARASLQMGNEAYVDTGYVWATIDNLEGNDVQKMLY
ncbi:MAG: substrate-binding domain-containing protein [Lachnospiraceae bacterium]